MDKQYCAFIFARGGSKGVKNKNIRSVGKKPLIAYSIESALKSRYIKDVIVSTDSDEIARVSEQYGAQILKRPENLAEDSTPEILAWRHAIELKQNELSSVFISLPATSPLRSSIDIDNSINEFQKGHCDILFGISNCHRNPYLNMVKINSDNCLEIIIPGSQAVRRQDVQQVYDVTTCVYIADIEYIKTCQTLMQGRVGYIKIPIERSIDIDTEFDLYLANLMLANPFPSIESSPQISES